MGAVYCKYHPQQKARRYCPDCSIHFCGQCAPYSPQGAVKFPCPVCKNGTEEVSAANLVEPVWNRIPELIAFPSNGKTLITIVLLILSMLLVFGAIAVFRVVGLVAALAWIFIFFQHGFSIVQHVASRGLHKDSFGLEGEIAKGPVLKYFVATAVYFVVVGYLAFMQVLGPAAVVVFYILYMALMPALIILLVTTNSMVNALNPLRVFGTAFEIGWTYLALVGLTLVSSLAGQAGSSALTLILPAWLAFPLAFVVTFYFFYVQMAFIGYVLHQKHDHFGIQVHADQVAEQQQGKKAVEPVDASLSQAQILVAEGKTAEALAFLKQKTNIENANEALNEYYQKLLTLEDQSEELKRHGQQYVRSLFFANKQHKAYQVTTQLLQTNPAFELDNAKVCLGVANSAALAGAHKVVVQLLRKFDSRFPGAAETAQAYFLAAKSLSDGLGKDKEALNILRTLEKRFPDMPNMDEVVAQRKLVESLLGQS